MRLYTDLRFEFLISSSSLSYLNKSNVVLLNAIWNIYFFIKKLHLYISVLGFKYNTQDFI